MTSSAIALLRIGPAARVPHPGSDARIARTADAGSLARVTQSGGSPAYGDNVDNPAARWMVRLRPIGDPLFAAAFAAAWLIGLGVTEGGPGGRPHLAVLVVIALAMTVPFAWRCTAPAAVAVVVFSAGTLQGILFRQELPIGFVLTALVGAYTIGSQLPWRASLLVGGYSLACVEAASVLTSTEGLPSKLFTAPLFMGLPWAAGRLVDRLRSQSHTLSGLNVRLEVERDGLARASVLEERSRIARELHDIVAHSISVMVVQAGAAEQLIEPGNRALEPLSVIRSTGRQALAEMRLLLGLLRAEDPEASSLAPLAGFGHISGLVDQVRRDGIAVTYDVRGEPVALPTGVDIAAYRLVQEALSNVRKHARASSAAVTLTFDRNTLCIEVVDDGVGAAGCVDGGTGHGLIGMRERVLLYGGSLTAGALEGRGWRISALLPFTA